MNVLSWLIAFIFTENLILRWGSEAHKNLPVFSRINLKQLIATSIFIFIGSFFGYLSYYILSLVSDIYLIGFFISPILIFGISILLKLFFQKTFLKNHYWLPFFHYNIISPILLAYLIFQKAASPLEAIFASLGSGIGYIIVALTFKFIISHITFEKILKPSSTIVFHFIILAIMGLVFQIASSIFASFINSGLHPLGL